MSYLLFKVTFPTEVLSVLHPDILLRLCAIPQVGRRLVVQKAHGLLVQRVWNQLRLQKDQAAVPSSEIGPQMCLMFLEW